LFLLVQSLSIALSRADDFMHFLYIFPPRSLFERISVRFPLEKGQRGGDGVGLGESRGEQRRGGNSKEMKI